LGVKCGFNRLYQIANFFAIGRCLLDDYQDISGFGIANFYRLFQYRQTSILLLLFK
jgi:hypothetical protein